MNICDFLGCFTVKGLQKWSVITQRKIKEERCNGCRKNTEPWESRKAPEGGAEKFRLGPTWEGGPKE